MAWQVQNWYNFGWLSGDSLAEQAVHSVDKIGWATGDIDPISAVATGGRQILPKEGISMTTSTWFTNTQTMSGVTLAPASKPVAMAKTMTTSTELPEPL